jgi:hypothetical protein
VTIKETSTRFDTVRVNKWPSSTLAGWQWYGVVVEGVSHPARNCILHFCINALNIYCIFPYTRQPLLLASLKPTRLFPKSQPMEYFKSIHHVCWMYLNQIAISANLSLHRKYTSKFMELRTVSAEIPDTTNLHAHKMSASTTSSHVKQITLLVIQPSHLFHKYKKDLWFTFNYIWLKLGSLRTYSTITLATKLTTTKCYQAQRRSILPTLYIPTSIATKGLNPTESAGHGLRTYR